VDIMVINFNNIFLLMLVWGSNTTELPVIYDGLLILTFVNLIVCIYEGLQK